MTRAQMYKALVRSHLDYCDIIYHMLSHHNQAPLGVTLNSLMEKVERNSISSSPCHSLLMPGMVQIVQNFTRN